MEKYGNNTIIYARIVRINGYGQYQLICKWIDQDGAFVESKLHSTNSILYDEFHNPEDDQEEEMAQQNIAVIVIDHYYSI